MEEWERNEFQRRIEALERKLEDAELSLHLLEDDRQMEFEAWAKREEYLNERLRLERQILEARIVAQRDKWRTCMTRMKAKEGIIDELKYQINRLKEHLKFLLHKDDEE